MSFFREVNEPFLVTEKQLTATFKEQVLIIGDMRKTIGRPKQSVIGSERKQLTIDVGQTVIAAILSDIEKRNGKLDKHLTHLYTAKGQREWAGTKLSQMAAVHWGAKGGNDIETGWKFVGDLIKIGINEKGRNIYVSAAGSTDLEMGMFLSLVRGRGVKQSQRNATAISILKSLVRAMGNRTLEAAYAEDCSNYRFQTTGT
jgi:hypothetical protein